VRIISYSLYGDRPMYLQGMVENARLAAQFYPNWHVRVYCEDSIDTRELEALGCQIHRMGKSFGQAGMFWRFLPAWDRGTSFVIFRDADSRLGPREAAAVNAWLDSGLACHAMHDHQHHLSIPLMGGMWGIMGNFLPSFLLAKCVEVYSGHAEKGRDSLFLAKEIWPFVRESCLTHSSFPLNKFQPYPLVIPAKPFPPHPQWAGFVGQQHLEDGPTWPGR